MLPLHLQDCSPRVFVVVAVNRSVVIGTQADEISETVALAVSLGWVVSLRAGLCASDMTHVGDEHSVIVEKKALTLRKGAPIPRQSKQLL
jgi:hypothetical protein